LGADIFVEAGNAGSAITLNTQVVLVHLDAEETVLTPVSAPRVAANPVLLAILSHTVANNRNFVVQVNKSELLRVDTTVVSFEIAGCLNAAADWTMLSKFRLHLVNTDD